MHLSDREAFFRDLIATMDRGHKPIRVAINDTLVLNYLHYGESALIRQLRWLPVSEIALATIFIVIAYLGFSTIKRSEQSNIWVGMAKETAHQLGTPLSSIMGWMERMREDAQSEPRLVDTITEMEQDVNRLNKVAARFSKIGSKPDLHEESLTEVLEGVISYIGKRIPKAGKKVELLIETPGTFIAPINRELFEWVIENLMKNALDALEGAAGKISFSISESGRWTILDVTDTGKGIDPKLHKEIFRPGYSTKKRGWGLGLTLSKRIIEEYHKGRLYVKQSAPGMGTTFQDSVTAVSPCEAAKLSDEATSPLNASARFRGPMQSHSPCPCEERFVSDRSNLTLKSPLNLNSAPPPDTGLSRTYSVPVSASPIHSHQLQ